MEDQCDRVNRETGFCKSSVSHSTKRTYSFFLSFFKSGTHVSFDRLQKCFVLFLLATIHSPMSTRRVEASLYIVSKITTYQEKGSSLAWELIKWLAKCCDLLKIISSSPLKPLYTVQISTFLTTCLVGISPQDRVTNISSTQST